MQVAGSQTNKQSYNCGPYLSPINNKYNTEKDISELSLKQCTKPCRKGYASSYSYTDEMRWVDTGEAKTQQQQMAGFSFTSIFSTPSECGY